MELPREVRNIIDTLEARGYEAYAVGGCVRDLFLGRVPQDFDVTTSAKPEEVKACFRRTVDTGIKHGTVTVMFGKKGYEVTTFRIDGVYEDARHPDSVTFTPDLREDLRRRDFTINAMAYSEKRGVIDLFGGQDDLERRVVRAVGVPEERFREDALRILRCVRFAAQLDFSVDPGTFEAAKKLAPSLNRISRERVREEFMKILLSDHPEYLDFLCDIGAMRDILPEYPEDSRKLTAVLRILPKDSVLRLAAVFSCGAAKKEPDIVMQLPGLRAEAAEERLKTLRFDRVTVQKTAHLVRNTGVPLSAEGPVLRRSVSAAGKEAFPDLLTLIRALRTAEGGDTEILARMEEGYREILETGVCTSVKELDITGRDLMDAGIPKGPEVGLLLDRLLLAVLDCPEKNRKNVLLRLISQDHASSCLPVQ